MKTTAEIDPQLVKQLREKTNAGFMDRSEEHTSELQSRLHLVCRLLLEKKKITTNSDYYLYDRLSVQIHSYLPVGYSLHHIQIYTYCLYNNNSLVIAMIRTYTPPPRSTR